MLQMKIKTGRRSVVPGDLPSILGARRAYRELGDMVEALIAQMDMLAGDCDLEDDGPEFNVEDEGEDQFPASMTPKYGVDQSASPINAAELEAAYLAHEDARWQRDHRRWERAIGRGVAA